VQNGLTLKSQSKYGKVLPKLLNRTSTIIYREIRYLPGKLGYTENQSDWAPSSFFIIGYIY